MGGAVLSTMDAHNAESMYDIPEVEEYRQLVAKGLLREIAPPDDDKSTPAYRATKYDDARYDSIKQSYYAASFLHTFRQLAEKRTDSYVMGYRKVIDQKKEEILDPITGKPKVMDITYFGETVNFTYGQVWEMIESFGRGLRQLGVSPGANVVIYQETCMEWFVAAYGIWNVEMVPTTVFANLGEAALTYAFNECEPAAIVCGGANAKMIINLIRSGVIPSCPVICIGRQPNPADVADLDFHSYDSVLELGKEPKVPGRWDDPVVPKPDDLALIMYTSGTTGTPKGVMHTHGSLVASLNGFGAYITEPLGERQEGETHIAYLPMAHIMEFTIMNVFIQRGSFVGFGTPRTLTDATARPHGDLKEFKPHFFAGVPRMYDTFKKAIEANLPEEGSVRRQVYDHAYQSRLKAIKAGKDTPYWNKKVFATTRDLLGGQVRVLLTGSAPISKDLEDFIRVVFGPCLAAYGMTEACAQGFSAPVSETNPSEGAMLEPGCDFKLVDVEGFTKHDKPNPRGEICFRGPCLFKGYYKQPKLTKEAIDEHGWYHTGDVGMMTPEGKVAIVGRTKALVKNSLGEFIPIEALEAIMRGNPILQPNGICVLVHPNKNYIAAVGITDEKCAMDFAKANSLAGEWPSILDTTEFQEAARNSLVETAKAANRAPFEWVRHVRILNDEWTPENDVLTAAQKLKRTVVHERYADIIAELFKDP